jgi:hypothetical protein
MALSGLLCYAIGLRDLLFLLGLLIAFFPTMVALQLALKRIWTPNLHPSGRAVINIRNTRGGS